MADFIRVLHGAAAGFFLLGLAVAFIGDLRHFRIPNWIPLGLVAAFVAAALLRGWPLEPLLSHLGAGAVLLGVGVVLYMRRYIHGGDVKLIAAVAVWTGWRHLPSFLLIMALIGGALAAALLLFRRRPLPAALAAIPWIQRLHLAGRDVPYGVAIAAAGWTVFFNLPVVWGAD